MNKNVIAYSLRIPNFGHPTITCSWVLLIRHIYREREQYRNAHIDKLPKTWFYNSKNTGYLGQLFNEGNLSQYCIEKRNKN